MRERGMENDPRYQQMLNFARMSGLPMMGNNTMNPAGITITNVVFRCYLTRWKLSHASFSLSKILFTRASLEKNDRLFK